MSFGLNSKRTQKLLAGTLSKEVLSLGVFCLLNSTLTSAAEWRFTPSIDLTETYTDNVTLISGSGSESDWISQINPALSLTGTGKNLELAFGYRMQNILYAGDSDRNNTNHQLNSNVHATLAPRWLFLDASSSLSQQVLSSSDNVSVGNLGVVDGREDVLTASVSPYIATRLGSYVLTDLRFTHDRVFYSGTGAADSSSDQVSVNFQSAKAFGSWTWAMRYTEQEIRYFGQSPSLNREDVELRDTVVDLAYQLSSKIRLTGQAGYEENKYQLDVDSETPEGRYWSLGAVWSPSSQTTLSASRGHRYFGHTWMLDWSHQARRHSWQLAYIEDISSRRQLQLDQNSSPESSSSILEQSVVLGDALLPTDEIFIDRRADFQWSMSHRKSTTTFQLNRSRREFQESSVTEITSGVDFAWDWRLARNAELSADIGIQKIESDAGKDHYKIASLNYEKQLGRRVNSSVELRNVRRNTSGASNSYRENQLSASLTISW